MGELTVRRRYPRVGQTVTVGTRQWTVTAIHREPNGRISFYEVIDLSGHYPNAFRPNELA